MGGDDMSTKQGWSEIEQAQAVQGRIEGGMEGRREREGEGGKT